MRQPPKSAIHTANRRWMIYSTMFLVSAIASAQSTPQITIRIFDSRTGLPITGSEFMLSFDNLPDSKIAGLDPYWKEGGERHGILDIPFEPSGVSMAVRSSYGPANWGYVNCDAVKDRGPYPIHWYEVAEILKSGISAPNHCTKRQIKAAPGEFVFYVRPMTLREKMHD